MAKEIELIDWTAKKAARMARARIIRMRKAADEFQRDISILYEDCDHYLCETARDLDIEVNQELDKIEEAVIQFTTESAS